MVSYYYNLYLASSIKPKVGIFYSKYLLVYYYNDLENGFMMNAGKVSHGPLSYHNNITYVGMSHRITRVCPGKSYFVGLASFVSRVRGCGICER